MLPQNPLEFLYHHNLKHENHYYFLDENIKYNDKINVEKPDVQGNRYDNTEFNHHDPENQINHIIEKIKEYKNIQFEIYTNCSKLKDKQNIFSNLLIK